MSLPTKHGYAGQRTAQRLYSAFESHPNFRLVWSESRQHFELLGSKDTPESKIIDILVHPSDWGWFPSLAGRTSNGDFIIRLQSSPQKSHNGSSQSALELIAWAITDEASSPDLATLNQIDTTASAELHGMHLNIEDLILPGTLSGKRYCTDFVLLAHYPYRGVAKRIRSEGLKSLAQLASEPDATEQTKKFYETRSKNRMFGNNPNFIYFRPLEPTATPERYSDAIIVAAHPRSVNVFDQEYRAEASTSRSRQENLYKNFSMNVLEYLRILKTLSYCECLNQFGRPIRHSQLDSGSFRTYIPEVVVATRKIRPELFVHTQDVRRLLQS
ncbi:uncharacterized protein FFNC_15652 [Fusarium fujikuroi]|nr:uncharacterized protein FFNC_15652 [Fusarium fujikuroi]